MRLGRHPRERCERRRAPVSLHVSHVSWPDGAVSYVLARLACDSSSKTSFFLVMFREFRDFRSEFHDFYVMRERHTTGEMRFQTAPPPPPPIES